MAVPAPVPEISRAPELHVMIAGLPRNGKSTGLNNIFEVHFEAKVSAKPVTSKVVTTKVKKNGISLNVIDTPGLKAANANQDEATLREMKKVGDNTVLLLLTLPVSSNSCITQDYHNIIENITTILGPGVWNWCLVLLTFSDEVRENEFPTDKDHQNYQDYLNEHCMELQKVFAKIGVRKQVKLFCEYASPEQFEEERLDGIVAIPVGRVPDIPTERLFPLQPWTHEYKWTDLAFKEITKLSKEAQQQEKLNVTSKIQEANALRSALIQFRYGCITFNDIVEAGRDSAAQGAKYGEQVGECVGPLVGAFIMARKKPIGDIREGIELGGKLGSLVGAIAGGLSVGGTKAAMLLIRYINERWKLRQLEQQLNELEKNK